MMHEATTSKDAPKGPDAMDVEFPDPEPHAEVVGEKDRWWAFGFNIYN